MQELQKSQSNKTFLPIDAVLYPKQDPDPKDAADLSTVKKKKHAKNDIFDTIPGLKGYGAAGKQIIKAIKKTPDTASSTNVIG